jgi:hypothetical protein
MCGETKQERGPVRQREGTARGQSWLLVLAVLLLLAGCGSRREVTVVAPDGAPFAVDAKVLKGLAGLRDETGLMLEWVLLAAGHRAVDRLSVVGPDGERREFDWAAIAGDAWWQRGGQIAVAGEVLPVSRLEVTPPALVDQLQAEIVDIAPTAAAMLGLPTPALASGRALVDLRASHVLLVFLDGFGYMRYTQSLEAGLIPHLAALGEPLVGLTVYPPSTSVATAALLTGAPPEVNGVDRRGIRKTEAQTLFDVATVAGLRVVAVEGEALAFNLRNAETTLSGDRDGDGSTDDNVLANALAVIEAGMPDLFYVHFHGIDDAGHTYGPGAPEEMAAIRAVDAAVGRLLAELPQDTAAILFADHGMHSVKEEGRVGNHGHLIEEDMFIPIWVVSR